ncbi:MAG: hypothetical protein IPM69_15450 [Ignavibacteria bacterium]|nr:hypothetical protein [Ignavibacteria bacterium]
MTIQVQKNIGNRVSVRIVSALGTEIAKHTINNYAVWNISTNSLPSGMYSVIAHAVETGKLLGVTNFVIVR